MTDLFTQGTLNLSSPRPLTGRGDFFTTLENVSAVSLIDSFPNAFYGAVIYGEKGSGKTHLAHLFAQTVLEKTNQEAVFVSGKDLSDASFEQTLIKTPYLIIEDIATGVDETVLFHVLNTIKEGKGFVFMTSEISPSLWKLSLPDLKTRLKALPCVEILPPSEALIQAVLLKQFNDRQLSVSPDVISYLLKNMERSFKAISFVTKRADELSLSEKRSITIPLIKKVLAEL